MKNKGLSDLTTVESAIYALENESLLSGMVGGTYIILLGKPNFVTLAYEIHN